MKTPDQNDNESLALTGQDPHQRPCAAANSTSTWDMSPEHVQLGGSRLDPIANAMRLAKLPGNHLNTVTAHANAVVNKEQKGKRSAIAKVIEVTLAQLKEAAAHLREVAKQLDHTDPRNPIKGSLRLGVLGLLGMFAILMVICLLWAVENLSGAMLLKESGVFGIDALWKGCALLATPLGLGLIFGKLVVPYTLGRKARRKFIIFSIVATVVLFALWVWSFAGSAGEAMAQMAALLDMENGGTTTEETDLQSTGATHPMVMFLSSVALMFFSSIVSQAGLLAYLGKFQSYEPNPVFQELEEEFAVAAASVSSLEMGMARVAQVTAQMDADRDLVVSEARSTYITHKTSFPAWPGLNPA